MVMPNPTPQPVALENMPSAVPVPQQAVPQNPSPATLPLTTLPSPQPVLQAQNNNHNAELDARLNALSNHVEDLQKSLQQATQQLTQVSSMMATNQVNNGPNPALDDRLNKIEQHLMQIEHAAPPTLSSPSVMANDTGLAKPDISMGGNVGSKSSAVHTAHHTHVATSQPVHTAKTVHKTVKHKGHKAPSSDVDVAADSSAGVLEAPHSSWVLRAATPNEAWVAKNDSSSDLTHVRVGETLPGIGQVQSIRPIGDSWVIEGTDGVVR